MFYQFKTHNLMTLYRDYSVQNNPTLNTIYVKIISQRHIININYTLVNSSDLEKYYNVQVQATYHLPLFFVKYYYRSGG